VTCWIVIPAKAPQEAKGRLSGVLNADQRHKLAARMLDRAIQAARLARGADGVAARLVLVGPSRLGVSDDIEWLPEPVGTSPAGGLNAALSFARQQIAQRGATRLVSLAGDLPGITVADVSLLCSLPPGVIGIAPDRHGTGTNALSLPLPEALDFTYGYGPGSCARHRAEAERLGLELVEITSSGLARDVDEPADLAEAVELTIPLR